MTKDDIIRMAREAGMFKLFGDPNSPEVLSGKSIDRFAKLVVANVDPKSFMSWQEGYEAGVVAKREECAKLIEAYPEWIGNKAKQEIAAAIRAGGTT